MEKLVLAFVLALATVIGGRSAGRPVIVNGERVRPTVTDTPPPSPTPTVTALPTQAPASHAVDCAALLPPFGQHTYDDVRNALNCNREHNDSALFCPPGYETVFNSSECWRAVYSLTAPAPTPTPPAYP